MGGGVDFLVEKSKLFEVFEKYMYDWKTELTIETKISDAVQSRGVYTTVITIEIFRVSGPNWWITDHPEPPYGSKFTQGVSRTQPLD